MANSWYQNFIKPFRSTKRQSEYSNVEKLETGDVTFIKHSQRPTLDSSGEELSKIAQQWIKTYTSYENQWRDKVKELEDYYLGRQPVRSELFVDKPDKDNVLFQAVETFLPQATGRNADPVVESRSDEMGIEAARVIQDILEDEANIQQLRRKLKKVTRFWTIYLLGVVKHGWNTTLDKIDTEVIRPHRMIFDPDATITETGRYTGDYLGERRPITLWKFREKFPNLSKEVKSLINQDFGKNNEGTTIIYEEWWTPEMVFWTYKGHFLDKIPYPHWNEDGNNHFKVKGLFPYSFLTVFNLGHHPHDDTGLLHQNLAQQDRINNRLNQIDENIDGINHSLVISGDALSKEQAMEAAQAIRMGKTVWIPRGNAQTAISRFPVPSLPSDVFQSLQDARNELMNIFGTTGITSSQIAQEKTVRGKIISQQLDSSRIGGTITEAIENLATDIFNWWVQFIFVYFEEKNFEEYVGNERARKFIQAVRESSNPPRFVISVRENSMIAKDPMTKRSEAIDLWQLGAIDPLTLFERLEDPNPKETAKKYILSKMDINAYIQEYLSDNTLSGDVVGGTQDVPTNTVDTQNEVIPPGAPQSDGGDIINAINSNI
ncbi:MAG: hypothetical protein D6711_00090 [Chloroflexi bacterium]|nr:MAG: hypothetical protein D6711_00090 [Chloroflexota bacterium]